jgi:LasA protease
LIIPNRLGETSSRSKLLPDSEVTFSPSTTDFDIQEFVESAGGYLATHSQYLCHHWDNLRGGCDRPHRSGIFGQPQVVAGVFGVSIRLGIWISQDQKAIDYPMGHQDEAIKDLYLQAAWFASRVMDGYYGWKEGRRLVVGFNDGRILRLAPELNAGSVGLMNAFTFLYSFDEWGQLLYADENFFTFYEQMFGNPWIRAQQVEPLIPADVVQPEMILPFEPNIKWAFTGGPHAAWSAADVWAALDFAPPSSESRLS